MSSKKVTTRASRTVAPSGPGSGQEGSLAQEATATSTASTLHTTLATLPAMATPHQQEVASQTPPAVEAFTLEEIVPNSIEGTGNTGTQLFLQCNVATASMEEMQAEIHRLEQLEQRQQMKEKILTLRAKVSCIAAQEDCAMAAPLPQVLTGQAAEVPTIAVHIVGPNPLDSPTASVATAAALLGHGTSRAPIAGALTPGIPCPLSLCLQVSSSVMSRTSVGTTQVHG
jgi:hypothetical protein